MDNKQIAIKLIYDNLGLEFEMNTFQDRLILQKTIYLVQTLGVNLGYHYSWYLKGPYSTSLASDGFTIRDELNTGSDELKSWKLDDTISSKLESVRNWCDEGDKELLAKKLELYASVHFLVDKKQMDQNDVDQLVSTLHEYGKNFQTSEVEEAVKELLQHGAIN